MQVKDLIIPFIISAMDVELKAGIDIIILDLMSVSDVFWQFFTVSSFSASLPFR